MPRRPQWTLRDLPSQAGRCVVITGATGGIGLAQARALTAAGARVVLAVRNRAKGEALAAELGASAHVANLDVSELSSVQRFADACPEIDVLINNAGVMAIPLRRTTDGLEAQLATNHLGHHLLTSLLLDRIRDRVVVVASQAHRHSHPVVDDLNWERRPYSAYAAYADSKLANLLFLAELQRRLTAAGSTLRVTGAHPGYTSTGITANTGSRGFGLLSTAGNRLFGMSAEQGALPILFAATLDVPGNSYVGPHGPGELWGSPVLVGRSALASDPALARAVWAWSDSVTGASWSV